MCNPACAAQRTRAALPNQAAPGSNAAGDCGRPQGKPAGQPCMCPAGQPLSAQWPNGPRVSGPEHADVHSSACTRRCLCVTAVASSAGAAWGGSRAARDTALACRVRGGDGAAGCAAQWCAFGADVGGFMTPLHPLVSVPWTLFVACPWLCGKVACLLVRLQPCARLPATISRPCPQNKRFQCGNVIL